MQAASRLDGDIIADTSDYDAATVVLLQSDRLWVNAACHRHVGDGSSEVSPVGGEL